MIFDGKNVIVFDAYIKSTLFLITLHNTETNNSKTYKISEQCTDKNVNIELIAKTFNSNKTDETIFVGFGIHKNICKTINFIVDNYHNSLNSVGIYDYYRRISNGEINDDDTNPINKYFFSIDLQKTLFPKKNHCQLSQLFIYAYESGLKTDIPDYFESDDMYFVQSKSEARIYFIYWLLTNFRRKLDDRLKLYDKYKIRCLSSDDSITGIRAIIAKYCKLAKIKNRDLVDKTPPKLVKGSDILIKINYNNKIINEVYSEMLETIFDPTKKEDNSWSKNIVIENLPLSINVGGIRSVNRPKTYKNIVSYDIKSCFPSIMSNFNLFPKHLSNPIFKKVIRDTILRRFKSIRDGKVKESEFAKIVLNSLIGMMMKEESVVYDPTTNLAIRLNAILVTMKMIDIVLSRNEKLICVNIDSVFTYDNGTAGETKCEIERILSNYSVKEDDDDDNVSKRFLIHCNTSSKMALIDINNFVCSNGIKKGIFATSTIGHSRSTCRVLVNVFNRYVYEYDRPSKFVEYFKGIQQAAIEGNDSLCNFAESKTFSGEVYFGNERISNCVTYIVVDDKCTEGHKLKFKNGSKITYSQYKVIPLRRASRDNLRNLNMAYYLNEINKFVSGFQNRELFD